MAQYDELIERLRKAAINASEVRKSMAASKSLRQEGNVERRTDLYVWPQPEQTLEGMAAEALATLQRERAELVEKCAAAVRYHRDGAKTQRDLAKMNLPAVSPTIARAKACWHDECADDLAALNTATEKQGKS